ncbi:polysaccharide deacetylase family protein [Candidatus Pacearchaeota archaeon]|nr:polysaccharide deacetylase family protein [Candidatus Pacearchaeota archaeon]
MNRITYSVDVEPDLHGSGYRGVNQGLVKFEKLCDAHKVKPVLFVTADCIKQNPRLFLRLQKKGWDVSLHGFTHTRFDEMSMNEKEREISQSLLYWKKYLKSKPKGFRAPQHSIDDETLDLLEKHGFQYDSSYTPLNAFQFLFFPRKLFLNLRSFFSPLQPYRIREKLREVPSSALLLPFVSLTIRFLPRWLISIYIHLIHLIYRQPVFYAHSWDFISQKDSRIDRLVSHNSFIKKLAYCMERFR